MPAAGDRKHILTTVTVKLGCSTTSRLAAFFSLRPHRRGSSTTTTTTTTSTFSSSSAADTSYSSDLDSSSDIKSLRAVQGFGRIGGQSMAVEKDSDDPYLDFRRSMLQMILEKQLYSEDDLKHLLNCFLQLNSPYYHGIIIRAFTEIWNGVYSVAPSASPDARMYPDF